MQDIPMPAILDAERARLVAAVDAAPDDTQRLTLVRADLRDACGYGQHLWRQLAAVRGYLVEVLPDPHADDDATHLLTAPRGPDDDAGWERWRTAYEAVTSALAGPNGDEGFGRHEAAQEATGRRGALHAGPRTADLARDTAAAAVQVEQARSDGYVVGREAAPASSAPPPATAPRSSPAGPHAGLPAGPIAAVVAVAAAVAFVAGRRSVRVT